ncbi:MAG: MBL fold metallo-hydrolase [Burkholderiales bacterium]
MTARDEPDFSRGENASVLRHNFNEVDRNARRFLRRDARMHFSLACLFSFALICLPGCAGSSDGLPVDFGASQIPPGDPAYRTEVQIKYLGAGGVLIKRGEDVLLTAPFFSNPSLLRMVFGEIKSLPEQVNRFLGSTGDDLAPATAVLVGHAHYDHLMDMPYIKKKYLPNAKIYGSETMKNILAGDHTLMPDDVVSVERDVVGNAKQPGRWWDASQRLRFMALTSEHAPHIAGLKFFKGKYPEPLQELPTRAWGWREGQTLAYLIEFLSADGKTVEFRVHYQDAASNAPLGFPPPSNDPKERIDLAIVCMPGFDEVEKYPEEIVDRLQPRFVVIIHWENFFDRLPDDPRDLRVVPAQDAERFLARLKTKLPEDAVFKLPAPGAWMRFAP